MSNADTETATLLQQLSVPKILLISALVGGALGVINNFLPGSLTWDDEVVELPYLGWALKTIFVALVLRIIVRSFKNGKFE